MMKKKLFYLISLIQILFGFSLHAQIAPDTYWITFTDKNNSPYSIHSPEEFLSERAILRRLKQGIAITEEDIPVNKTYLDILENLGVKILNASKWFNGAAIISTDIALLDTLHYLPFIKDPISRGSGLVQKNAVKKVFPIEINTKSDEYIEPQLEMLYLNQLHQKGLKGDGMLIGILDAGFKNSQQIESLKHIWENKKVLAIKDFVKDSNNILNAHLHGTLVLSIIAADWTDKLQGSAPDANFVLVRTENGNSEYLVEEYNWIAGVEYADSIGVDIINSSLGYAQFDNPSQNHTYTDLDGKTTPISIAASIAQRKGMLIVTSAGNSGDEPWYYITAPGDADSILTVGAVDLSENIAGFSSRGPTADDRIKPDVSAMGKGTSGQIYPSSVTRCNGTSCSSPIIAGFAACLWMEHPKTTNQQLINAIKESSHLYSQPNNNYGYGIPNALIANELLYEVDSAKGLAKILLYPNPTVDNAYIYLDLPWLTKVVEGSITLVDLNGRILQFKTKELKPGLNIFSLKEIRDLNAGYYIIQLSVEGRNYSFSLIKLD